MNAEILTIGSELTSGATLNSNAAYLARRLADVGLPCQRHVTVGDERVALLDALREALRRADVLVTTGGLGPTFDDITLEAIAEVTQRPLVHHPSVALKIRRFYRRGHRALQRAALRQARLPRGTEVLPNAIGTAPGVWLALPGALVVALPGVPGEMRAMMEQHVLPRLKRLRGPGVIESRTLRTVGVVELSIEAVLRRIPLPKQIQVGLYPHLRMVDIRLTSTRRSRPAARRALARIEATLRRRLGEAVYGTDEETLEGVVGALLVSQQKTLGIAESCTGGLVSERITDVPGSSRYFRGSVIAYHNDLKRGCLGVSAATLARVGAVSAQAAKQMAAGVRHLTGADVGLAVTGIAGPTGGTKTKPVGLVYLGLADGRRILTQRHQFFGDRSAVRSQATQAALDWLRRYLLNSPTNET
jgi:nicotinamide-nucleotide amidase